MIINYGLSNDLGDADFDEANLMVLLCIAVLTILSIVCICTLYCCLRKYIFSKPLGKTASPFAALSKKAFQPVIVHQITSDQNAIEHCNKAISDTKKRPDLATGISRGRRAKPIRQARGAGHLNAPSGGTSSYNMQVSNPLDKRSITAEMFTSNVNTNSRKEILLFKAPSFTE